jgi:hypothetical protein
MNDESAVVDLDLMNDAPHAMAARTTLCELLQWIDATQSLPDSDITVLCWITQDSEFFCGYWDAEAEGWIACENGGMVPGVTHWAEPRGPVAC